MIFAIKPSMSTLSPPAGGDGLLGYDGGLAGALLVGTGMLMVPAELEAGPAEDDGK